MALNVLLVLPPECCSHSHVLPSLCAAKDQTKSSVHARKPCYQLSSILKHDFCFVFFFLEIKTNKTFTKIVLLESVNSLKDYLTGIVAFGLSNKFLRQDLMYLRLSLCMLAVMDGLELCDPNASNSQGLGLSVTILN